MLGILHTTTKERALYLGRWLVMLPLATGGSWLAAHAVNATMENATWFSWLGDESFPLVLARETIGHMVLGVFFVSIGVYLAPSHKRVALYIVTTLTLAFAILMVCSVFVYTPTDYWVVYGAAILANSAFATAQSIKNKGFASEVVSKTAEP